MGDPTGHSLTAQGLEAHWGSLPAAAREVRGELDSGCCVQGVVVEGHGGEKDTCALSCPLVSFQVDRILRQALSAPGLAAMSAGVIHNDTVLWTGNFGKKNGSDPASGPPNEYTMYRSAGGPVAEGVKDGRTRRTWEAGGLMRIMTRWGWGGGSELPGPFLKSWQFYR